ncbi:MAG: TatD family hydrolase [Fibrobacter sp.]|nr:TatD family hydrolase [Fibrobacter sp.]
MFDFHLHLLRFSSPLTAQGELLDAGCGFNTVACEPWEWETTLNMESRDGAYRAFGIHPMIAGKISEKDLERLEEILSGNQDFQVGECGLDKRFEGYEEGGVQERVFRRQVEMACSLRRPLQIHCVGDYSRILRIIQKEEACAKTENPIPQVIFHRFGGDISVARSALKQFGSRVLFSLHQDSFRKKSTITAIREIPSEQVRFETDADDKSWTAQKIIAQLQDIKYQYDTLVQAE